MASNYTQDSANTASFVLFTSRIRVLVIVSLIPIQRHRLNQNRKKSTNQQ